jgi:hypothetical protein
MIMAQSISPQQVIGAWGRNQEKHNLRIAGTRPPLRSSLFILIGAMPSTAGRKWLLPDHIAQVYQANGRTTVRRIPDYEEINAR